MLKKILIVGAFLRLATGCESASIKNNNCDSGMVCDMVLDMATPPEDMAAPPVDMASPPLDMTVSGDLQPIPAGALVINEICYDNVGIDANEFVEILNTGTTAVDLTGVALVLVNGANNLQYNRISLASAGTLSPGGYVVVASATTTVDSTAKRINFANASSNIENGSPDGVALIDTAALSVLDALSYEGSITMATIPGFPNTVNLVESMPLSRNQDGTVVNSLIRNPNGTDTNNADADWQLTTVPTPGKANTYVP